MDAFLNPVILFFFLGLLASAIKSDLEIPPTTAKFLSLFLLFSIGLKGGSELAHTSFTDAILSLSAALVFAIVVPLYTFFILKKRFKIEDAGAVAATYGSVSAVTFITATDFLHNAEIAYGGHMIAALALMESPAIIIGLFLINRYRTPEPGQEPLRMGHILREALTNGSVVLILGALLIGWISTDESVAALQPFTADIFKGMLAFFLLDMGLLAGRRLKTLLKKGAFAFAFALFIPILNALVAIAVAYGLGLEHGDALLLTVLAASASYIAVPAAIRMAVPEADAGLFVPMSLAITFPFNIVVGIPLYDHILSLLIP
jgi:hypothetical protein